MGRSGEEVRGWENWVRVQRDLAQALCSPVELHDMLERCLDAAMRGAGLDSGGIFLVDDATGDLCLAAHDGLSEGFLREEQRHSPDSPSGRLVFAGEPIYQHYSEFPQVEGTLRRDEGLQAVAIVPLRCGERIIGCLNLASHAQAEVPEHVRLGLETVALQIGNAIAMRRAQDAYRESEDRYRTVSELTSDYSYSFRVAADGDLTAEWVTGGLERLTGFSVDDLLQRGGWETLIHAADLPIALEQLAALLRGERAVVEYRIVHRSGEMRWMRDHARPEIDEPTGCVTHIHGAVRDITERRHAEAGYRALFDGVGDAIMVLDPDGTILDANAEAASRLGYEREELLALPLPSLLTEEFAALAPARLEELKRNHHATFETAHVTKDGRAIPTEISATYLVRGGRHTIFSVARDLTERKRLEEELNQLRKMEAIGQLAGGIAHDFNNMLCPILGYSDLIVLSSTDSGRFLEEALAIREAAEHASAMTRQLLVFSRRQITRKTLLDLNEQLSSLEGMLRRLLGESIELVLSLGAGPAVIRADATQLQQVAMNLAINARDAMPEGGRLLLSTSVVQIRSAGALAEVPPGSYVVLAAEDTGCGMPPEILGEIFLPFFTTKEPGKGTGLGLATVYGIVKEHEGFVRVVSQPGRGSTFRVHFPEVVETLPAPGPAMLEDLQARGREVVLVVEDEDLVRNLAVSILARNGYEILEAAGGPEAIRLVQERDEALDLLLTDVVMPGMSGAALFDALEAARPGLRVLFMSGYLENVLTGDPASWSTPHFLPKPFTARALLQGVREALDDATAPLPGDAPSAR